MRVTVGMIVGQIGAGHTIEEILSDPYLEREDVLQRFGTRRGLPKTAKLVTHRYEADRLIIWLRDCK